MKRVLGFTFILFLMTYAFSGYAACERKVFDPLEPINKTIPPNILVVVDNSGSMMQDTRNLFLWDYRTNQEIYWDTPSTGDYYHYNLEQQDDQTKIQFVPTISWFDYYQTDILQQLSSSYYETTFNVTDSGKVDYVAVAVDVWLPENMDREDSDITIAVEKDGKEYEIHPTDQWFYYRESDGSAYYKDVKDESELSSGGTSTSTYTYTSSDTPKSIRDYRYTYSYIDVPDNFTIGSLTVHIDITHSYIGDLYIRLYAPDGSYVNLWTYDGGSANDIHQDFTVTGFNGKNANGTWKLMVYDGGRGDQGTLDSWSLNFTEGSSGGGGDYVRYRVQYAFPNFYGLEKNGQWKVKVKTNSGENIYLDKVAIDFNPYVSKMTAMKTVLQRIFEENPEVRFALGTYKAHSSDATVWDSDGLRRYSSYWYVTSDNPGLSLWVNWPDDELETQDNRAELINWVDMKDANNDEYDGSVRKEIFARGYTPIQSCMSNVRDFLKDAYSNDLYQACRNYAVIYLTDGRCTEYGCSETTIRDTIKAIYNDHVIQVGTSNRGTKTYIIGLSLTEDDREWLDDWADAGDDGNYLNDTGHAYLPQNSEELMQAFADAVHSASSQEVVINSDVIFGTINPDNAPSGTIFKASQFTTPSGQSYDGSYPAIEANIMFTTKIYYPSWDGDLIAYMPMYRSAADQKLYYFPQIYDSSSGTYKPDYPVIWSAKDVLEKRLDGYEEDGNHVPGIRDALGLTDSSTTQDDNIPWRNIKLIVPSGSYPSFTYVNLTSFVYDDAQQKWVPSDALVNEVAQYVYPGDSDAVEKAKKFIEFVQSRMLADITYSSPATIYEPGMGFEDWRESYLKFKIVERKVRTPVVVVGANDGMLHGFNAYTGKEEWAVIPWGVIDSLKEMVDNYDPNNNPSGQVDINNQDALGRNMHIYGVASSPKVVDVGTLDDDNPDNDEWNTLLVCGLGGGGNSYFCLDVTDPLHPEPKWDTSTNSDFNDLGETWAYPSMWLSKLGDDYYNVGFFTSGYSLDDSKGKSLYVMDLKTGDLMFSKELISSSNDDFLFAAPAGILGSDARYIKGVYVGSTYGELFRYDLQENSVCNVFNTNNGYAIITLPAVYVDSSNNEWVSLGELGCSDVYNGTFANDAVLYTIKAYPTEDCNGSKNLVDITSQINSTNYNTSIPLEGKDGYYFNLKYNETMFADPLITTYFYEDPDSGALQFETVSVFVTYEYPTTGDYCGLGKSYLYIFGVTDLFVGTREDDQSDYGSMVSRGRSGSPVKTGVSGTVWINTPDGPLRIMPLDDSAGSSSIPVYSPFAPSCSDAKKVGAGSWIVY